MRSRRTRAVQARPLPTAPRTPRKTELRSDHTGWSSRAVQAVQVGGPGAIPVGERVGPGGPPSLSPLHARERREIDSATAWTTWTGQTREVATDDCEASRSRVSAQLAHRARAGRRGVAAWRRRALLALPSSTPAGITVRRGAHPSGSGACALEPRARASASVDRVPGQPSARRAARASAATCCWFEYSTVAGVASVVTDRSSFGGSVGPPPSALQTSLPLNSGLTWRIS